MSAAPPHPPPPHALDLPTPRLTLVAPAGGRPGYDDFEVSALRRLGSGHHRQVARDLASSGRRDLAAALLVGEVRLRELDIDVASMQVLAERVDTLEPRGSRLRPWVGALLAERLLLDGQAPALFVARRALDELHERGLPVLPPLALRYARARLLRVEAAGWLLTPTPEGRSEHRRKRDEALAELLNCGFAAEVHVTRAMAAGLASTQLHEDILENHARLVDARAALGDDDESLWPTVVDYFLAVSCFETGDMGGAVEAWDRMDRSPFRPRRLAVVPRYGPAFFRLVTAGASPLTVAGIERSLADVRRHDPRVAQHWYLHAAHTLADMGSRAAGHFARLEAELPALDEEPQLHRRLLGLRVDAIEGRPVSTETALAWLDRVVAGFGHTRRGARTAVRLGHDLAAGGDLDGARAVHGWGVAQLPAEDRRTVWESWWARPVDRHHASPPRMRWPTAGAPGRMAVRSAAAADRGGDGAARPSGRPGLEVRVLAPTVEVDVDGRPVALSDAQAKLLLAVVVAHPAPLHVERASDVLWPDEVLAVTRPRLNSLVHRLRRVLGPHGRAMSRSGDLLTLDEERCRVDLWWFQRALGGDAEDRRRALLSVRGNLGDSQFPYDEGFLDERHRVSGDWMRHACRAHRGGEVAIADLEPALMSLKLTSDDLELRLA